MQDSKVTCMFDANGIKLSRFWENPDSSKEKNPQFYLTSLMNFLQSAGHMRTDKPSI